MISQIDGFYIAAQARLLRQVDKRAILLVEGNTDARVLEHFIDPKACDVEIAFGKRNVLTALDLLEEDAFSGLIGLVDADFDRLLGVTYSVENVCLTDHHDLDLTIFASSALGRYVGEHADPDRFEASYDSNLQVLRTAIARSSLPLAICRFVSERDGLRLYFKDLRHEDYVSADDLSVDLNGLVAGIIDRSSTRCTVDQLLRLVAAEGTKNHDTLQLTNGHDVAAFLGIAFRKMLGKKRQQQTWASEIESGLRLALDWGAFVQTKMYDCVRHWEAQNKPYRIFKAQTA
jgi:hypothetical protein